MLKSLKKIISVKAKAKAIICDKCQHIPLITIINTDPLVLHLKCNFCDFQKEISLKKIILKEPMIELSSENNNTSFNNFDLEKVINNTNEMKKFLNIEFPQIKNNFITRLKEQIQFVEESFAKAKKVNDNILSFISLLFQMYSKTDLNTITNIINNTQFNLYIKQLDKTEFSFEQVIGYYKKSLIITLSKVPKEISNPDKIKVISTHTQPVYSLCLLKDGRLASSSFDKTIMVHNIHSNKCEMIIKGHELFVYYIIQNTNGNLVSCSGDKTIKIWEISSSSKYTCIGTLRKHTKWVEKVIQLRKSLNFASCSADKTIIIWNHRPPYIPLKVLTGHTSIIHSLFEIRDKNCFVSGGRDFTLRFWSSENYECEKILYDIFCSNKDSIIEIDEKLFIGGTNIINIVDLITFQVILKINQDDIGGVNCFLKLNEQTVLYGCGKGMLCYLDIKEGKCFIKKENVHDGSIYAAIKINDNFITTAGLDGAIKFVNILY